jgi:hypothetical protein
VSTFFLRFSIRWRASFAVVVVLPAPCRPAHGGHQLAVHDAHQGLTRIERTGHFLAQGLLLDPCDEVAHHRQGHIRLEQGHAHLAQHVLDIALGDAGLAPHFLDQARKFVGEG